MHCLNFIYSRNDTHIKKLKFSRVIKKTENEDTTDIQKLLLYSVLCLNISKHKDIMYVPLQ